MKTYQFLVPVERASGTRVYHIRAATLKDAKAIYDAGNAECLDEELEVERVGEPEITEITEIEP